MKHLLLMVALYAAYATVSETLFFNRKIDCLVTEWSNWSEPFGFGSISRERQVLRYPLNGGTPCPPLYEVRDIGVQPTIQQTADQFKTNFVYQNTYRNGEPVGQLRDLLLIVDASGSVGEKNFTKAKTQLARLMGYLCPVPDPFNGFQQAALLRYSSNVNEVFDFNDKSNTQQVKNGITSMSYVGGSTCTASAFRYAKDYMFTTAKGMRIASNVKQDVLILTDGQSNCGGNAILEAAALKTKASVFGLMIGVKTSAGMNETMQYVSEPLNKHLFAIKGYQELETLLDLVKFWLTMIPCAPFDIINDNLQNHL